MLAVAAGLSLGKEGPMVHIAICLGKVQRILSPGALDLIAFFFFFFAGYPNRQYIFLSISKIWSK